MNRSHPPESVEEALRRAAVHARNSLAEAVAACRALLDAISLVATQHTAESSSGLASLASVLEQLESQLASSGEAQSTKSTREPLALALTQALDAEIARWERRAERDAEARGVLRAFLGLREILWEMGVRSERPQSTEEAPEPQVPTQPRKPGRVQRVHVHG